MIGKDYVLSVSSLDLFLHKVMQDIDTRGKYTQNMPLISYINDIVLDFRNSSIIADMFQNL